MGKGGLLGTDGSRSGKGIVTGSLGGHGLGPGITGEIGSCGITGSSPIGAIIETGSGKHSSSPTRRELGSVI
jgi:hypothetical protein